MKPLSKQLSTTDHPTLSGVEGRPASYYTFYSTPYGTGAIIFNQQGVKFLLLPQSEKTLKQKVRGKDCENRHKISYNIGSFSLLSLRRVLGEYFAGKAVEFDFPLDLSQFSQFERDVYKTVRKISYGEAKSYQEVAKKVGRPKASRAVGNALAKNPIPVIVPCHRVVRKDGKLGGFSAGFDWKKRLLQLEKNK